MNNYKSFALTNLINNEIKRLVTNCFITFSFGILGVLIIYNSNGRIINSFYLFTMVLYLGGIGYALYTQVVGGGIILNKTVINVEVSEEEIILRTPPIKVLFLINKPSLERSFKFNQIRVTSTSYPLKQIYDLNGGVFVLSDKVKDYMIISDYFEKGLKELLLELYNR